jgi:YVTN family beta-propeller protein
VLSGLGPILRIEDPVIALSVDKQNVVDTPPLATGITLDRSSLPDDFVDQVLWPEYLVADQLQIVACSWVTVEVHRADVLPCKVVRREFAISRIAHGGGESVSKVDVSTNMVTATVTVGDGPNGVGFDGSNIWVANALDATVSKIVP